MNRFGNLRIEKPLIFALLVFLITLAGFSALEKNDNTALLADSVQSSDDEFHISVDVGLVLLPVVVTDNRGEPVSNLQKNDFHVFDDGQPQQISVFDAQDVPVTVGLVVDNSGSMGRKRPEVVAAAEEFARSSNPQDQLFVVNFNGRVTMGLPNGVPFTGDIQQLRGALTRLPAAGNTALYDGVAVALDHLTVGTANRKALIIVSDGGDNASHTRFPELVKKAEATNAQIYTLGVYDESYEGQDMNVLRRLAKVTGGKAYFPDSPAQMTGICEQIAQDLRHQYTLGYHPGNSNSANAYHTVRVVVTAANSGKLHVSTRAGYLAPSISPAPAPAKASL